MNLFLVSFFLVYAVFHLYAYLKTESTVTLSRKARILLPAFMALMIASPVIIRLAENAGLELVARILSYIGYIWMGLLFLFISTAITFDILRLLFFLIGKLAGIKLNPAVPLAKITFYISICVAIMISIFGYFEARNIKTEHLTIRSSKIPESFGKLRIVQISDVHLGLIVGGERLKRILKIVKKAAPDILVSTGDLVDGQINRLTGLSELLIEVRPRYGKYAVTGNHEFYAGLQQALAFTEKAGFKVLRGESVEVERVINITGVDDRQARAFRLFKGRPERELLSELSQERFNILLKHRPLVDAGSTGLFDLQLSGHTHKGQIFPFSLFTKMLFPLNSGYMSVADNSHLYVSRGTGTWGPPVRFLSPPEVTIIDIVNN